jgi:integral membrane protein
VLTSAVGRLRLVGLLEGASYLLLLGVAMPLKYWAGMPLAVRVVGMAHGVLFVAFVAALLLAWRARRWSVLRAAGLFVACLIPFGTFVVDRGLREEQAAR